MKMTKYLIALGGFCAVIIWATTSSCSNKEVSVPCNNDSTFATASAVLEGKCNRCHGDSITASKFGQGIMINGKDSVDVLKWVTAKGNIDTSNASTADYGILVNDITGKNPHLMPLNGPKLTDCEIAAIKNWIWHYYIQP